MHPIAVQLHLPTYAVNRDDEPDTRTAQAPTVSLYWCVGTVKNHGKKVQKTRHTFKKITKNTAKTRHQNAMYF